MFKWRKLGKLFDPTVMSDQPWMFHFAQTPSLVNFGDFLRIYFCTRPPAEANGQFVSRIGFIDIDPNNLFRILRISREPVLPLGGLGTFDEFGTNPVSVIRHGDEIRAYYAGVTRCESVPFNAAIGLAISTDGGENFERLGPGPVLSYSPDEPFVIGSPKIRLFDGLWFLHYAAGRSWLRTGGRPEPVYKLRCATSQDGVRWSKWNRDLLCDRLGEDECQAGGDILFHEGRYHMFFSYRHPVGYKTKSKGYRIGYAGSDDLKHWVRHDEAAGLDVSPDGWDSEMVSYAHVFKHQGQVFMLYQGNAIGRCGFGLAVMESYVEGGGS